MDEVFFICVSEKRFERNYLEKLDKIVEKESQRLQNENLECKFDLLDVEFADTEVLNRLEQIKKNSKANVSFIMSESLKEIIKNSKQWNTLLQ